LTHLSEFDPRKSRIAELRFFGGLTLAGTDDVREFRRCSAATVALSRPRDAALTGPDAHGR
jgi:hypothetical protein